MCIHEEIICKKKKCFSDVHPQRIRDLRCGPRTFLTWFVLLYEIYTLQEEMYFKRCPLSAVFLYLLLACITCLLRCCMYSGCIITSQHTNASTKMHSTGVDVAHCVPYGSSLFCVCTPLCKGTEVSQGVRYFNLL